MPHEFDLIRAIADRVQSSSDSGVQLGIGDDAAVLRTDPQRELVLCTDTLVDGVHFPPQTTPADLGFKAAAVNLSDLAAMGARPRWMLLALTVPDGDQDWVEAFLGGMEAATQPHQVTLVGGDTSQGPLSITVVAAGDVPPGTALTRGGAGSGDCIAVTGCIGDAALALQIGSTSSSWDRLMRPTARVEAGQALVQLASSCIDISDGLVADCGHLAEASGLGFRIDVDAIPTSTAFDRDCPAADRDRLCLQGGDDYELCFTFPPDRGSEIGQAMDRSGTVWSVIGEVSDQFSGVQVHRGGQPIEIQRTGYRHFDAS